MLRCAPLGMKLFDKAPSMHYVAWRAYAQYGGMMVRPKKNRLVGFNPKINYFKPRGIRVIDLDEVCLTVDEREAMRLADLLGLSHEEAGARMGVSRATFGRIIQRARHTVADAIINGKAVRVEGGNYELVEGTRTFVCHHCEHTWEEPFGTGRPDSCSACGGREFHRQASDQSTPGVGRRPQAEVANGPALAHRFDDSD